METEVIDLSPDGLRATLDMVQGVAVLRGVLEDQACRSVVVLLSELAAGQAGVSVSAAYATAFRDLAAVADQEPVRGLSDAWQAHLTALILDDANPWSAQAESMGPDGAGAGMRAQARHDLAALQALFALDAGSICRGATIAARLKPGAAGRWVPWNDLASPRAADSGNEARSAMRRLLAESRDWPGLTGALEEHWSRHGTGVVARYRVLRWEGAPTGWRGIAHPDPVGLTDLIGYEREKSLLTTNVERFLAGLPAHHALLYGPPGTGKSSTVKAIANAYAGRGLRLVEVRKDDLRDLPAIVAMVRGRAPRFLLFVDDLSFEEDETQYKALKALLEGAAEAHPENLLLYATTNRRNLVRESFADRGQPGDDVHGRDTLHEKISLAARFGLRVTFSLPDQDQYVVIARELARGRGLELPDDEMRARALAWERQHGARSGRTARQFVDDLEAELRGRAWPHAYA